MSDDCRFKASEKLEWYAERWWQDDQYRGFMTDMRAEDVDVAIERVERLFDSKWIARSTADHPAWFFLTAQGTLPLECLAELGADLVAVDGVLRLPSVIHDLRVASHFESVRAELALGAMFRRAGFDLEFRPALPSGKAADLMVGDGTERVFFELKRLITSEAQRAVQWLTLSIIRAVGDLLRTEPWAGIAGLGYQIELSDGIKDLLGAGLECDRASVHGITTALVAELKACLENGNIPFECEVAGLVRLRVGPDLVTQVRGPMLSPIADLKRAMTKFLQRAGDQLHPSHPGFLVCQTGSILDRAAARICVEPLLAGQGDARHVAAVVFLPVYTARPNRFPIFQPFSVVNPHAAYAARELSAFQALVQHYAIAY